MKLRFLAIYLLINITLSSAAVFFDYSNNTDHPGKCVIKDLNLILSPGDIVPHPHKCMRYLCYDDGLISGQSCGAIGPPPGCILGERENPEAPYPSCCSRQFICNNIEKDNK